MTKKITHDIILIGDNVKTKLKLKRKFKVIIVLIILLIGAAFYASDKYDTYVYEQTYEFKFLSLGYTLEEIKMLESEFSDEKLDSFLKKDYDEDILNIIDENYYISQNFDEYYEYLKNEEYSVTDIIAIINVGADTDYYEETTEADSELNELMLVNKYNYLSSDYEPADLTTISTSYCWGDYGSQSINKTVYEAFILMSEAASAEGFDLMINSSYRSYEDQSEVYDYYKDSKGEAYADTIAARAGYSEHQTGYALDIFSLQSSSQTGFEESETYAWLLENSYKYGFIIRYPEDKEYITGYSFEPWHYRYVGESVANYIYENDITFDEYYAYFID